MWLMMLFSQRDISMETDIEVGQNDDDLDVALTREELNQIDMSAVKCYKCDLRGHFARDRQTYHASKTRGTKSRVFQPNRNKSPWTA